MGPEIRLFDPKDSITELTHLIRRAYKVLEDMGFNYTGAYQDEKTTSKRIEGYECYVMTDGSALIGTITLQRHSRYHAGKDVWFARQDVALCGQFAVDPRLQRQGLGARMMDFVERRAEALGAVELGLDTAEGSEHLIRFYRRRGYRFIDFIQHPGKTYRSVILSKSFEGVTSDNPAILGPPISQFHSVRSARDQKGIWEAVHGAGWCSAEATEPSELCLRASGLLKEGSRILEIGCGGGDDATFLASNGHDVLATDVSSNAIERVPTSHSSTPCLRFKQHDAAQQFEHSDGYFDAIYSRLALHYFTDQITRAVFQEVARLLTFDGLLIFMCKSVDDPLYGQGTKIEPGVFERDHLRHFFSEGYVRDLLSCGFEVEVIESKRGMLYGSESAWVEVVARRRE